MMVVYGVRALPVYNSDNMMRTLVITLSLLQLLLVVRSSKITNVAAIALPTPRRHSLSKLVTAASHPPRRRTSPPPQPPLEIEEEEEALPLTRQQHRRSFIQFAARNVILPFTTTLTATASDLTMDDNNNMVRITLTDSSMKLGLQLADRFDDWSLPDATDNTNTTLSTNDRSTIVYVQRIVVPSSRNANIQEGMILRQYSDAKQVQEQLLKAESYPITLQFQKPSHTLSFDASSTSSSSYHIVSISPTCTSTSTKSMDSPPPRSQRGNFLSIIYEARLDSPSGRIYDASYQRGTQQQPYQMVLGSGDMIIGVDQGLYDMCLDEVRGLEIPSRLAYGARGNTMFQIPPNRNLYWKVQLVRID